MDQCSRVDELSRRVLISANYPISITDTSQSPTPHLDELERALDIHLPPVCILGDEGVSGIQTCTTPEQQVNTSYCRYNNNDGSKSNAKDALWSWTPSTENIHNTYTTATVETLEDYAPFTPLFYRNCGDLIRECFQPGSVADVESSAAADANVDSGHDSPNDVTSTLCSALRSLEQYSLPRMHNAVRITRILLSLQEIHLDDHHAFLDKLFHYCEGNFRLSSDKPSTNKPIALMTKGAKIPIISSLFYHWNNLPQIEHGLQQLSRRYNVLLPTNADDYWQYTCNKSNSNTTTTLAASTIKDEAKPCRKWTPSSASESSFLGARAMRIDSFKSRLEGELSSHINGDNDSRKLNQNLQQGGLVRLLSLIYKVSDAEQRGKIRKWLGQGLRSHALGGGSVSYSKGLGSGDAIQKLGLGPSFTSFCPLITASNTGSSVGKTFFGSSKPVSLTQLGEERSGGLQHNSLGMENTSACGVEGLLQVLLLIISGFQLDDPSSCKEQTDTSRRSTVIKSSHENLLFDVLIPLHRPSGMVLWRDQTPLIGLYHEELVKCIAALINMDLTLVGPVIGTLLHPDVWPTEGGARASNGATGALRGAAANTPKVVLLIHEVDTLIGLLQSKQESEVERCLSFFGPHILPLVMKLCSCISSDNSRTSERALQLFKNNMFKRLVKRYLDEVGPHFLRALCRCSRGGTSWEIPWNPTVRKMSLLVLRELEGFYNDQSDSAFGIACDESFDSYLKSQSKSASTDEFSEGKKEVSKRAVIGSQPNVTEISGTGNMTSLRSAMGSWRPPLRTNKLAKPSSDVSAPVSRPPPSTITGVAPWAMRTTQIHSSTTKSRSGSSQPPLTVTGVAPWAMTQNIESAPSLTHVARRPTQNKSHALPLSPVDNERPEVAIARKYKSRDETHGMQDQSSMISSPAVMKVRSYMDTLKLCDEDEKNDDGISSWAKAQMEESPVLLPNLKFHDLVFGQELGTGAFSTVKYARQIVKNRTRSKWPEFAVKVVSTQKIEELGYEQSINREIAILRIMSHPGIARLISSFRFRDGAYLVLEYASGGDLHTLLRKNGSLDHESTKFVIGSVAAALSSIHERGFVYADCKPENILVTESGHIKITDFGGCRPLTDDAKALVLSSSKDLIEHLRCGDWKTTSVLPVKVSDNMATSSSDPDQNSEDLRIEGTTAYLPPEVVLGGFPTAPADVWALGCVLFQCLSGRPPLLEDSDELTAQKIVSFNLTLQSHDLFGNHKGTTFDDTEKALIKKMLNRDINCRPSIPEIANDDYFNGMNIFSLHTKESHPLDIGTIAPSSDAKWSRRQFSTIWAPQPHAYTIGTSTPHSNAISSTLKDPIIEGDEANVFFYLTQKTPLLAKIRES